MFYINLVCLIYICFLNKVTNLADFIWYKESIPHNFMWLIYNMTPTLIHSGDTYVETGSWSHSDSFGRRGNSIWAVEGNARGI